ncbi:MAG: hypothetical protein KGY75_01090 [Candidatus Cloacimonetes bacterium]|nr:hypothetical protein [Candidatus Cloacimonadota bacterium]MBS3766707.1 hypothetical protein [Candidatus Cloacimonadota bacterium]
MKKISIISVLIASLLIAYCSSSTSNNSHNGSINITNPSDGDIITNIFTKVEADVSTKNSEIKVEFAIDNIVYKIDSIAPYSYDWHNFYWADGNAHSIKVTAHDSESWWAHDSISVTVSEEAGTHPTVISPADSSVYTVGDSITFSWNSLPEASQYFIEFSQLKNDNRGTVFDTVYTTSFIESGNYSWKLQAENYGLESDFSPEYYFSILE